VYKYVNEAETIRKLFQCFISVLFHRLRWTLADGHQSTFKCILNLLYLIVHRTITIRYDRRV